jgi:hypothetical protein
MSRILSLGLAALAACSIPDTAFHASPDGGDDHSSVQSIVLSTTTLTVPEGMMGTFDVSLMFDPGTTVTVNVANANPTALPLDRSSIPFTAENFATPVRVTVSPPIDSNNVSETATITASGAGAATPATVMLTAMDGTVVQTWGWPTAFPSTTSVPAGTVVAYLLDVGAVANVDSFYTYVPTATGSFRMALYTNVANAPGALVAEMPAGKILANGPNDGPILNGPLLMDPTYFLVIRFSQDVNVGYAAAGVTGRQCIRNFGIPTISDPWPSSFGATACTVDRLINISLTTYHQ